MPDHVPPGPIEVVFVSRTQDREDFRFPQLNKIEPDRRFGDQFVNVNLVEERTDLDPVIGEDIHAYEA